MWETWPVHSFKGWPDLNRHVKKASEAKASIRSALSTADRIIKAGREELQEEQE